MKTPSPTVPDLASRRALAASAITRATSEHTACARQLTPWEVVTMANGSAQVRASFKAAHGRKVWQSLAERTCATGGQTGHSEVENAARVARAMNETYPLVPPSAVDLTLRDFTRGALIDWSTLSEGINSGHALEVSRAAESDAERLILLGEYLSAIAHGQEHTGARKRACQTVAKVRRAMGYSYPQSGLASVTF